MTVLRPLLRRIFDVDHEFEVGFGISLEDFPQKSSFYFVKMYGDWLKSVILSKQQKKIKNRCVSIFPQLSSGHFELSYVLIALIGSSNCKIRA